MPVRFAAALLAIVLLSASCGFVEGKGAAEKAVDQFHEQFNLEQYGEIYAAADAQFKGATTVAALTQLLQAVRRKIGTFKQATQTNSNVYSGTDGTSVTLVYASEFTQGRATEQFRYTIVGGKGILLAYNINSPDLILR